MHEWPHEEVLKLDAAVSHLEAAQSHLDPLMGLMAISTMSDVIPDLAAELAKIASRAGYTNKRIANALGVSPATLRGLKEEARITHDQGRYALDAHGRLEVPLRKE